MFLKDHNWLKWVLAAALLSVTAVGFCKLPGLRVRFSPDYLWQIDFRRMNAVTRLLGVNVSKLQEYLASPPTPATGGYLDKIRYNLQIQEMKRRVVYLKRRLPLAESMLPSLEAEARSLGSRAGLPPEKNANLQRILALEKRCREYRQNLKVISANLAEIYGFHP